jgi:purine nucleoside permease
MPPIPIRAVIAAAFEPDDSPVPGELTHFLQSLSLTERLPLPAAYRPLYFNAATGILAIAVGVGAARAAASIMALGLDSSGPAARFDLTRAYWLITGVCGIDPARGSLASVVLPEYIVDGDLTHEIDAREIPASHPAWPDGFIPIGKSTPYEQPLAQRFNNDDGIVFRLDPQLLQRAYQAIKDLELTDKPAMALRRRQFPHPDTAWREPHVLLGAELSSSTFWHGKLMSERARRWVSYQTEDRGTYTITAMEDAGILQSLANLANAGLVARDRTLIVRAASNYDQQREGIDPAQSLAETKVTSYSAYLPALENAHRAATHLLRHLCLAEEPKP